MLVANLLYQQIVTFEARHEKTCFCICENTCADKLRRKIIAELNSAFFRYIESTTSLLPKSEISSFWPSSVAVQSGLNRTWSETMNTGFLKTQLI